MWSVSIGPTAVAGADFDHVFNFEKIEGSQLDRICGDYYGLKVGLGLIFGGSAFSAINDEGIIMLSSALVGGLKTDVSGLRVNIKCLNKKNPNWKKVVRF